VPDPPVAAAPERKALASGTLPPDHNAPLPLMSRTATLDDPLTTSLLAEISRRSRTIEVSADQIAEAQAIAPGAADEPGEADERDPFAELEAEMAAERGEAPMPPRARR